MFNFSDPDHQHLVYYIILLVFLISGFVVGRKINFSQSLKYIAIWLGIAFVVIVLYSYRFEFSDFKNRVLGEISPMTALHDQEGRVIINMSRDGHFYINIKVNGQMVRFLVDTGASDTVLNVKDARKVGINFRKLIFNKRYSTANGFVMGASTTIAEMKVGDIVFYDVEASVNGADLDTSLLGMSFLSKFTRYEFFQGKLILKR